MNKKFNTVWKTLLIIFGALIPIGLGVGLFLNIKTTNNHEKSLIEQEINDHLGTQKSIKKKEARKTIINTNGPYWTLEKIDYIKNKLNYNIQSSKLNFDNLFYIKNDPTGQPPTTSYYINTLKTATNIHLDANASKLINNIESINLTTMLDNLKNNYHLKYNEATNSTFSLISPNINQYRNAILDNDYYNVPDAAFFDFNCKKEQINIKDFKVDVDHKYHQIGTPDYLNQIIIDYDATVPNSNRNEISSDVYKFLVQKYFNNNPTYSKYSRIIFRPANLIIYRYNQNFHYLTKLNDTSAIKKLVKNNASMITLDDWAESCINSNPDANFDFRSYNALKIKNLTSINLPRIIVYNENNNTYSEPDLIINNILNAKNPVNNNRNWGNNVFDKVTDLKVSMRGIKNKPFNILDANNLHKASTYTNAVANIYDQQNVGSELFFTLPKLTKFDTNDIDTYVDNFASLTYIPIIQSYLKYFNNPAYDIFKNINLNFVCEQPNNITSPTNNLSDGFHFNLTNYLTSNPSLAPENDYITNISIILNNYFNYFNRNRNTIIANKNDPTIYFEFANNAINQWQTKTINDPTNTTTGLTNLYRYEFLYNIYDTFTKIVLPFSMIQKIQDTFNPMWLKNYENYPNIQGNWIGRFIDQTTNTIVYNADIYYKNKLQTYPLTTLDEVSFNNFIDQKLSQATTNTISLTFDDWIKNRWSRIDPNLNVFKIMKNKQVTFDEFCLPNIIIMNKPNVQLLTNISNNRDLIISLVLIILIVVFSILELIIIIIIIKTKNHNNWLYKKLQDHYSF